MSTKTQIRAVTKAFLSRHPEFILVDRMLIMTPVQHIIRAIVFLPGTDKDLFEPNWGFNYLFTPRSQANLLWHMPIRRTSGSWNIHEDGIAEELAEQLETQALPVLQPVNSIQDFMDFTTSSDCFFLPGWNASFWRQPLFEAMLGDLDGARRSLCRLWHPKIIPINAPLGLEMPQKLGPLLARDDREGIAKVLHEWEEKSAKIYGVEKHWQPTPFPIEEQVERGMAQP
ncbi:hypothetical protein GCM10007301_35700 [Azorhizobium oxalatiphilum]|uniref:Uncharacterized protein n=1 Tax=Azorhizobium oxalatiphilum TaxID=980631 RepID=A0A917FE55_9HYPH|nr:hypothetical protein [Azorhizobium oxalatiphilum]GGF72736.1 hypothetical protein GCM10007301_35700 [Azorhizobium oxalatiphilum]